MGKTYLLLNRWSISQAAFFSCCLIIAGMFTTEFARVLPSIGIIGLFLTALLSLREREGSVSFKKHPAFLGFILLFFMHLLGYFQTDPGNFSEYQRDLILKLPLLILPLSFILLPAIESIRLKKLYYFFVLCVFAGSLFTMGYYLANYEAVNESYKHSKVMVTPTNHVRFSMMVAFAILVSFHFYRTGFYWFRTWEKWLLLGITIWLLVFLHILAVRTGLVAFYSAACLGLAFDLFFRRKYYRSLVLGLILGFTVVGAFFTIPTFYNKFFLTIRDVESVSTVKSAHDYSISGRVYSYKVALEVFKENPVFGAGIGNMPVELGKKYKSMFPSILSRGYILPHNEFLYVLTAFGIVGLVIFVVCFFYPATFLTSRFDLLYLLHYYIISLSFLFETTLETQVGLTYSLIFILLPLWHFKGNPESPAPWKNSTFLS